MPAIDRYIFRQVSLAALFVTGGFTFAIWLTQSLRFVDYIVNKGLPVTSFLMLVGLMLPSFLAVILPISAFFGVIFVYNKLVTDSEMIVLRAAGSSPWALARPALFLAGILTVIGYVLTLYLMPVAYGGFKDWQFEIRNYSGVVIQEGIFNNPLPGVTVFVRDRSPAGALEGVLIHDGRDHEHATTIMAETGTLVAGKNGPRVILEKGNRQELSREDGQLQLLYFERWTLDLSTGQGTPATRWRDTRERHLLELLNPPAETDPRNLNTFRAEAHQRLASPLYNTALILVALAILFSGQYNRRGQTRLIVITLLAGLAVQGGALVFQNLAGKSEALVPLIYLNVLIPILLSVILLSYPQLLQRRSQPGPSDGVDGDASTAAV